MPQCGMVKRNSRYDVLAPNVGTRAQMSQDLIRRPRIMVRLELKLTDIDAPTQRGDTPWRSGEQSENVLDLGR